MIDNEIVEKKPWKQLTLLQRVKIEALLKAGLKPSKIAEEIKCSVRTVQREIKRGTVTVWSTVYDPVAIEAKAKRERKCRMEYSADAADLANKEAESKKGRHLKIGNNYELESFLEEKIVNKKLSPYAALEEAKRENKPFAGLISVKTLYSYIDKDVFLNITNKNLLRKRNQKKRHYGVVKRLASNNRTGRSIEDRDKAILKRNAVGHWEMDTVYGKGKTCLLVLTERVSRLEEIIKLPDRTQKSVVRALDKIEKRMGATAFRKKYKTITMDNGGEFLNQALLEKSCLNNKKNRTKAFYCHPFSSWERGSNENQNAIIRRFIPKGSDISKYTNKYIKEIENYINLMPRFLQKGSNSYEIYEQNLCSLMV